MDLNLQGNAITTLPEGSLSALSMLEALTLTGNKISQLPRDMGRCERLQTLYAGANDITDPSPAFEPPCIIHAGLAHNKISCLPPPEVTSRAEAMLSLDLTHNNLTSLPDALEALSHMPALRSLSLAGNPLALVPGYKNAVVGVLKELQILDGVPVEVDHNADPNAPAQKARDAPRPETVTLRVAVTDISYAADPPPPPPPPPPPLTDGGDGEDEDAGAAEGGDGDGGDGEGEPAEAPEDKAVFFVQYSLAGCGGGESLAQPIRTPKVRRTPPPDGEEGEAVAAAAAGDGEGEDGEGAATAAAGDGDETFLATLPLTAATRDVLNAGVEFELYRVDMVPAPPPRSVTPAPPPPEGEDGEGGEGEAAAGAADGEVLAGEGGAEEAETGGEGVDGEGDDGEPTLVEHLTMVGSAVVKLGALLAGDVAEITAPVSFVPGPAMFGEALVGEVLLPLEGQPEQPSRGAATVTFTLHVPPPPPPPPQVEEEGAGGAEGEGTTTES